MIQLASSNMEPEIRHMWKICFDDSDEFIQLYFREKYKKENTLVYFEGRKAVASLQMLPYNFTFYGSEIPVSYICGACTLPDYRNRGHMEELILAAFKIMHTRNIPLSILIPAEEWLYGYYKRYGYETVFKGDNKIIPLKKIVEQSEGNLSTAYSVFDKSFRHKDFCVQKTKQDFITIVKDAQLENFPSKTNLSGMARIIDTEKLLSYFAKRYRDKSFFIQTEDKYLNYNNCIFEIKNGKVYKKAENTDKNMLVCNENTLCQLLFGFNLKSLPEKLTVNFESHSPIMNLMLE